MSSGTVAPNLPGLEDGCREEGLVLGEWQIRAQVCTIPFVPAVDLHTPFTQMELCT